VDTATQLCQWHRFPLLTPTVQWLLLLSMPAPGCLHPRWPASTTPHLALSNSCQPSPTTRTACMLPFKPPQCAHRCPRFTFTADQELVVRVLVGDGCCWPVCLPCLLLPTIPCAMTHSAPLVDTSMAHGRGEKGYLRIVRRGPWRLDKGLYWEGIYSASYPTLDAVAVRQGVATASLQALPPCPGPPPKPPRPPPSPP